MDDIEKIYTIGEVSSKFGLSDATIRKYEKDFSINIPRSELGHRFYRDKEIAVFEQIVKLKEQGANIHVINNLLNRSVDFQEQQQESLDLITMDKMTGLEVKQLLTSYLSDALIEKENQLIEKYSNIENELEEVKKQNEDIQKQNESIKKQNEILIEMLQDQKEKQEEKKGFFNIFKK